MSLCNTIKKQNKSPLRYPGGKTRACKQLEEIARQYFDLKECSCIVSPFFGGGSFEFHMQNIFGMEILANDKFTPLYTFWKTCKTKSKELCDAIHQHIDKIDKSDFTRMRENILQEQDDIIQSMMYFIINRCSFSGATLSGGFSLEASKKRFTLSSVEKLQKLDLTAFNIHNMDVEDFLNNSQVLTQENAHNHLLFLDPPYYLEKKSKLYGNNGDMHEHFDHQKLRTCLSSHKKWMMTYNNCEYIRNLYKEYIIIDASWSYGMNKTKESSEIVIICL